MHDVSFSMKRGQGLAVIGPSGSGKSSLLRTLVGVWVLSRGRISLDRATLDQWAPQDLGRHIGYLPQGVELFAGTVAENISRFEYRADSELVLKAAQAANVHDLVVTLPQGYETQIGESGPALSPGQQQRIALARALYGDPFLVVLDEPDSNLDAEGQQALRQAILGVRARGGVVVVVSHRRNVLAAVDLLLAMQKGRMIAVGPKELVIQKLQSSGGPLVQSLKIVPDAGSRKT
jgi:ATP-binding cassette subfamily C protein